MNKAFTLIELLGVIVILGIIGAITIPIITGVLNDSSENTNNAQINNIKTAAKNWATANAFKIKDKDEVSVKTLKKEGYLENININNPTNNKSYNCSKVIINKKQNKYVFDFKYIKC